MTPILAAIPVDTLIWVVLLIIGAIGSIASNARKAAKTRATQPQAPQAVPTRQDQIRERLAARLTGALEQVVAQVPPPPPLPTPQPRRVAPQPAPATPPVSVSAAAHGTRGFRGMFERGSLVRAIVAAEVLGPPKALQEQSIWSPRHSEPSI